MKLLILFIFLVNIAVAAPVKSISEFKYQTTNFKFDPNAIKENQILYSVNIQSTDTFNKSNTLFKNLDTRSIGLQRGVKMVLTKSVFVVDKPLSFFSKERLLDAKFNQQTMANTTVYKRGANKFSVLVDDIFNYNYTLLVKYRSHKDHNLTSLKDQTVMKNILKFDHFKSHGVLALRESYNFDALSKGSSFATRHITRRDGKTVVISYGILAVKKLYAMPGLLESNLKKTIRGFKKAFLSM